MLEAQRSTADASGRVLKPRHGKGDSLLLTPSQQELESRLWEAANSLRGPVDPADFKAYVFPLLFFKWVSDTWDMEHEQAVADFGDGLGAAEEADYHRFDVPDGCHWNDLRATTTNVGVKLQNILGRLEEANPAKLAGIFGDVAWANKERLPEPALLNLIDTFDGLTLNPEAVPTDLLGAAYEYLLKQFADESGKKAGEFFTPRAVVNLLIHLLDPQPGERIYDPAVGSGGMLVETISAVRDKGGDPRTLRLYGQEVNLTTAAIARMNLYLHAIEDFQVLRGDTLRDPKFRTGSGDIERFDVVVANPPFSLKMWGADTWVSDPRAVCGIPPASKGDYAWVQHMVASMQEGTGRVGVVMPHGALFRGGVELKIRQCLVEKGLLQAVIGLPPNLFYSTPPGRAGIALAVPVTGFAEWPDTLAGALLVASFAAAFLTVAFLFVALFAVLVLRVALLAGVFFALAFLGRVLFGGIVRLLSANVHPAYLFALRGGRPRLASTRHRIAQSW